MKKWTRVGNVNLQPRKPTVSWATSTEVWSAGQGGDSPGLLCSCENPHGVLCPVLGSSVQERCRPVRVGAEEGHKNDQRGGTPLLEEQLIELDFFSPEKSRLLGRPYYSFLVLKWGL